MQYGAEAHPQGLRAGLASCGTHRNLRDSSALCRAWNEGPSCSPPGSQVSGRLQIILRQHLPVSMGCACPNSSLVPRRSLLRLSEAKFPFDPALLLSAPEMAVWIVDGHLKPSVGFPWIEVQRLRLHASKAGGMGSTPGQGTKIPYDVMVQPK